MERQSNPGYEKLPDIYEQFKKVFRQLPLGGCTLESSRHQYLERESEYSEPGFRQFVAPPGKIFKLTGDFEVETDSNDESYCYNTFPMPSISLLEKRMNEDPQEYEDEDSPFGPDFFYPQEAFYGKRLTVSIDGYKFGSPWRPNATDTDNITIEIEGPTDAYPEAGSRTIFLEDKSGSDFYMAYRYSNPLAFIVWEYDVASSPLKNIQIELVDDDLLSPEFKPVYADSQMHGEDKIWVPYSFRRQNSNLHIADDPLKDWWIPTEGANLNLSELADEIEASKGLEAAKKTYLDIVLGHDIKKELDIQPSYIDKKYLGKLAIVKSNMPLWEIAQEEQRRNLDKSIL